MPDTEELPMPTTREAKTSARTDGRRAYESGQKLAACPFSKRESELRSSWILGWVEGKMQREKFLKLIR